MTTHLADAGLVEVAAQVATRQVSPVELVTACLERIERFDGAIRAFVSVQAEEAMTAARDAEREIAGGSHRGPLHGIPVAIKDLADVRGLPTQAGSAVLADAAPARRDAAVVARLRAAGAILIGKTTTHEFAFSVFTPPTRNPWDLARVPGGSSGGSAAAVAAGMAFAALGTDTGGSIRIPAACCGVVGLKPTYGRVPKSGIVPLSWSLDHAGPIARRAEDAAAFLQAVAGPDASDPTTADAPVTDYAADSDRRLDGLRIGLPDRHFDRLLTSTVAAAVATVTGRLTELGATLTPVTMPTLDQTMDMHLLTILAEAAAYHRAAFPGRDAEYGADVRAALNDATTAFEQVDLLLTPTLPTEAPRVDQSVISYPDGQEDALTSLIRFTSPFNQTGLPAISVPISGGDGGLPVGLQLVAPPFAEALLIRAGAAAQALDGLPDRRPPLIRDDR
jgi:aspartyl-tRNA(Asn)/glutamyl-tRNA(Gln) amidotransferase subunit A